MVTTEPNTNEIAAAATSVERIVIAAGGDLAALAAARWVAHRARSHPVDVTLVAAEGDSRDGGRIERTADTLRTIAPALPIRPLQVPGNARHALIEAAARADLLVLGSNRVTPLARHLPPTLSVRVAEAANRPVAVVPSDWQPRTGPIVTGVALDGSDEAALRFGIAEAEALDRELVLVHVWHLSDVVTPVFAFALNESPIRAAHAARLAALVERVRADHPSLQLSSALVHGEAPAELLRRGATAELVIAGSHGFAPVDRVLLHSVGRALVERPPCPVALVPPRYSRAAEPEAAPPGDHEERPR